MKTTINEKTGEISFLFENEIEKSNYEKLAKESANITSAKVTISENEMKRIIIENYFETLKFNSGQKATFSNFSNEKITISKNTIFSVTSPQSEKSYNLKATLIKQTNTSENTKKNVIKFKFAEKNIVLNLTLFSLVFFIENEKNLKVEKAMFSLYNNCLVENK